MAKFVFKRLLALIPITLGVTLISFFIISLTPGDFLTTMSMNPEISPGQIESMRRDFGLDKPWYQQYALWLYRLSPVSIPLGLKVPDLGYSFSNKVPVIQLIPEKFFNTLVLTFSAEIFVWCFAIPLGIVAAMKRHTWVDKLSSFFVFFGISVPEILLALLALLFAAETRLFPIGGMHKLNYEILPLSEQIKDVFHHLVLPTLVLGITGMASMMRYMRSSLIETLTSDFIRTARAKGLSNRAVVMKHAFKNAINPIITLLGISFANLIGASLLVEIIMSWPGLGSLTYSAILSKDLYVIMASLVMATVFLMIGNLLADIFLALADPRIRYD